jgi:phage tail-like protein
MPLLPLNAVFTGGSNLLGGRLDPYMSFNFLVEVEGLLTGGFMDVSGLESEIQVEQYREGGLNHYVHHLPTRVEYPRLVLSRGLTDIDSLWSWYQDAAKGNVRRKNGTIMLLDRQHLPAMWWNFKDAYPVKWVGPQFSAGSATEVAVERIELVHKGIDKPLASRALSAARGAATLAGFTGTQQVSDSSSVQNVQAQARGVIRGI